MGCETDKTIVSSLQVDQLSMPMDVPHQNLILMVMGYRTITTNARIPLLELLLMQMDVNFNQMPTEMAFMTGMMHVQTRQMALLLMQMVVLIHNLMTTTMASQTIKTCAQTRQMALQQMQTGVPIHNLMMTTMASRMTKTCALTPPRVHLLTQTDVRLSPTLMAME